MSKCHYCQQEIDGQGIEKQLIVPFEYNPHFLFFHGECVEKYEGSEQEKQDDLKD